MASFRIFYINNFYWIIPLIVGGIIVPFIIFLLNHKEKQKNLIVSFSNCVLTYSWGISELMLFITVSNPSNKIVTINIPRILLPDGKTVVFPNPQSDVTFPFKLEERTNCKVWTEMRGLALLLKNNGYKGKINLKADVQDGVGNIYKSKKSWKLNIDEWLF